MSVADEFEDISMADLVAISATPLLPPVPSPVLNGATKEQGQVARNGATTLAETTSNDQPSGSTRPQTPPPSQPVFAASNPPSSSFEESIIVATQNTTLSPTKALQRAARSVDFDSPDPLRLVPVPSAASSAARSRSHSVEPPRSLLRSSPSSRASARPRSKTPVPRDHSGENDPSGSDEIVALGPTPSRARTPRPPALADDLSDDELTMNPLRDSTPRRQSQKVYPSKKKSTRTTQKGPKIVAEQEDDDHLAAVPKGSPSLEHAWSEGDSSRDPVKTDRPSFVIDEPAGSPTPRRSSELLAPSSSRSSPPHERGDAALAPNNGSGKLAAVSHPLSQTISREDLGSHSSPLTSLPPTPAVFQPLKLASTPPPPSPASKTKRSRARPPIPTVPSAQYSEDEGATTSSTSSKRSPRKKVKCRAPKSSQVAVVSSSDEGEASPQTSPRTPRGKAGRPSRTKSAPLGRRKSAGSDAPLEVLQIAAEMNRNPRRKSAGAAFKAPSPTQDDESEVDHADSGSDFEEGLKTSSPKKAPSHKKPGRPPKGEAAKAKKAPANKSKGKGKGKAKEASQSTLAADDEELTALAPIRTPASSPTKQKGLAAPEAFGSQSLVTGRATRQTAEERADGWNMHYFPVDRPIWVHRRAEGKSGFWWPGEIETSIFARPLSVKLYLDTDETIKNFTDVHLKIEKPDSETLATFRNPSRLRFDQRIFRDLEDAPADDTPTGEAFATVLTHALERDTGANEEDEEDDLMPIPFGPSGSKAARATALEKEASGDMEQLELAEPGQFSGDEADRLIEADAQEAEDAKFEYPFLCLAMADRTWWAARCTGYIPGSPSKPASSYGKGKGQAGKYVVEFTDGSTATIARKNLLAATEKKFFTVKMGLTGLDISKQYIARLKSFVTNDMVPIYQRVIDETFPMAQSRNDDFHAGGRKRESLANRSMFGELTDDIVEMFHNAISAWASGEGSESGPPQGSARYAALTDSERVQYRTDVLLPIAIIENYVDDRGLFDEAEAALKQEGSATPSDDEIKSRAYAMAEQDLDLRSVTKAVLAIRDSRDRVKAIAESRRVKRTR